MNTEALPPLDTGPLEPECYSSVRMAPSPILAAANSALDLATGEIFSNHASESGRWLKLMADLESREDFSEARADSA